FKLMAYKDEYEVARLHTSRDFREKLQQEFEGDFAVNYYLAPPLMPASLDARGRPRKRQFGPWITPLLGVLARLKFLRGTAFDVFGHTSERKMERELIAWYEQLLDQLLPRLGVEDSEELARIAAAPMEIRGFGPVKDAAVGAVKAKVAALTAGLSA
ncbi:MAG TPA: DUF6537 domain-containing protein, partial [Dehalococcoidia bacterium]|nr:DUF6537 domain-containing protein [Dehalococcoidia bacterium]